MSNKVKEYTNDLTLMKPFDLEKAKQGETVCWCRNTSDEYTFIAEYNDEYYFSRNGYGPAVKLMNIENLCMKPLCWVEGKPVYKGDVLWHTGEDCHDLWYTVTKVINEDDGVMVYSNGITSGINERATNLSWNKQEKQPEALPKVIHDPSKFKVGDTVKVVRKLPIKNYNDYGWDNTWEEHMNDYVGHVFVISKNHDRGCGGHDEYYLFPSCVLELVKSAPNIKILEVYLDGVLIKREEIEV